MTAGAGSEQADKAILRRNQHLTELLACGDVVPSAYNFDWISSRISDHLQIVADPAIIAIFLAKSVFVRKMALLKQPRVTFLIRARSAGCTRLRQNSGLSKIFFPLIAEEFLDVLAYERGPVVTGRFEGIDHCR